MNINLTFVTMCFSIASGDQDQRKNKIKNWHLRYCGPSSLSYRKTQLSPKVINLSGQFFEYIYF